MRGSYGYQRLISFIPLRLTLKGKKKVQNREKNLLLSQTMSSRTFYEGNATILEKVPPGPGTELRWLGGVFQGQYLPSFSINYVAINKYLENWQR